MVPDLTKLVGRPIGRLVPAVALAVPVLALPLAAPSHAGMLDPEATRPATAVEVSGAEQECLAIAVYFEARGEPRRGQAAVAQVILNRVEAESYPDTICGVVYQNQHRRNACQFSFACDGHPETITERRAWRRAKAVADAVLDGRDLVNETRLATHYHADYVKPRWAPKMRRLSRIGRHIFYRG